MCVCVCIYSVCVCTFNQRGGHGQTERRLRAYRLLHTNSQKSGPQYISQKKTLSTELLRFCACVFVQRCTHHRKQIVHFFLKKTWTTPKIEHFFIEHFFKDNFYFFNFFFENLCLGAIFQRSTDRWKKTERKKIKPLCLDAMVQRSKDKRKKTELKKNFVPGCHGPTVDRPGPWGHTPVNRCTKYRNRTAPYLAGNSGKWAFRDFT